MPAGSENRRTDLAVDRLRMWERDGFALVPLGGATDRLAPAALDLERAFAGAFDELWFHCPALSVPAIRWCPELTPWPAVAVDIHRASAAIRHLLDAPPVRRFLADLGDPAPELHATEGHLRPIPRPAGAGGPHVIGWFDLDAAPVRPDGTPAPRPGRLVVWPGSHRGVRAAPITLSVADGVVVMWHPGLVFELTAVPVLTVRRSILARFRPATPMEHRDP